MDEQVTGGGTLFGAETSDAENESRIVLKDAGMELDFAREELRTINGERVILRPQSFRVLRLLALNAGHVVSKSEIHDTVWGDAIVTDDSLVKAIHDLREVLGDSDHTMIRTVPRQGYELVAAAVVRAETQSTANEKSESHPGLLSGSGASNAPDQQAMGAGVRSGRVSLLLAVSILVLVGFLAWYQPWQSVPVVTAESLRPDALTSKPVVAVMPFSNIDEDGSQEHFADGLTEDLITTLAQFPDFAVIGRNSILRYKGQAVSMEQIRRELGARYVVSGGIRVNGDKLHVTAQLIETDSGAHLWAKSFDNNFAAFFEMQDALVNSISSHLLPPVRIAEKRRALAVPTSELDAYTLYIQARIEKHKLTPDSLLKSLELLDQALALDPQFARAHALHAYSNGILRVLTGSSPETYDLSLERIQKSLEIDPNQSLAYQAMSQVLSFMGRHEEAAEAGYRGIRINPNDSENHIIFSRAASTAGRYREAVESAEKACRLNPLFPKWYPWIYGRALYADGKVDLAVKVLMDGVVRLPYVVTSVHAIAALSHIGRINEARELVDGVKKQLPNLKLSRAVKVWGFREPRLNKQFESDLRNAGFPE